MFFGFGLLFSFFSVGTLPRQFPLFSSTCLTAFEGLQTWSGVRKQLVAGQVLSLLVEMTKVAALTPVRVVSKVQCLPDQSMSTKFVQNRPECPRDQAPRDVELLSQLAKLLQAAPSALEPQLETSAWSQLVRFGVHAPSSIYSQNQIP